MYFLQACNGPEGTFEFTKSRAMENSAGGDGGAIFSYCGLDLKTLVYRRQLRQGRGGRNLQPGIDHPAGGDHARSERVGLGREPWVESTLARNQRGHLAADSP